MLRRDPGRSLTTGEVALARDMFGAAIDCARVRIHRARWWPLQRPGTVMAPDGHVWIHPADPAWRDDYAHASIHLRGLIVHELTHVWQHQRGIRLPLRRHPFCRYAYAFVPGRPLARYGIEQQAEIVRHAFLLRNGVEVPGAPPLARYEGLLRF